MSAMAIVLATCNVLTPVCYAAEADEAPIEIIEIESEEQVNPVQEEIVEDTIDIPAENEETEEQIELTEDIVVDEDVFKEEKPLEESEMIDEGPKEETLQEEESFEVTFIDSIDDSEIARYTVLKNESVEQIPEAPEHDGYEFIEYEGNYTNVVCDEVVTAIYESVETDNNLVYMELSKEVSGYAIYVKGEMPKDTELIASVISNEVAESKVETEINGTFKAQVTFDIKLMSEGKEYEPTDYGKEVSVYIQGVSTEKDLDVFRITDDGVVTDMNAVTTADAVDFETDHFTTYTIGTTEYTSTKETTWHGMKCEFYDTDGDGTDDLVVVSGDQAFPARVPIESQEERDALVAKYAKGDVYLTMEGRDEIEFGRVGEDSLSPWNIDGITKCHIKDASLLSASRLFSGADRLEEIVLDNVDTSQCTSMDLMFWGCQKLTTLKITKPLNTENVRSMEMMFAFCDVLKTLDGENNFNGSYGLFTDTSKVKSFEMMFWGSIELESIDLTSIDGSSAETMANMFDVARNGSYGHESKLKTIKLPENLKLATDVSNMFAYNVRLEGGFNSANWDTSKVTNMEKMFYLCMALKELDVSNWEMSNVTTIEYMFNRCENLEVLNVSNWDVSNVTKMKQALSFLLNVRILDVSKWDTSNCQDMEGLFWGCQKVTALDVSNWNVSKVKNMFVMFYDCLSLEYLDLSKWDVSSVENFENGMSTRMFELCDSLRVIDLFRTDVIKEGVDIPEVPTENVGYVSSLNPRFMHIDDNKDGKADSPFERYKQFKRDSVSHRYIFDDNLIYPENSLSYINNNYTIVHLYEPSDKEGAVGPHSHDKDYGTFTFQRYLVKDFAIVNEEVIDDSDPLNKSGRAYVYTVRLDGKEIKVLAGSFGSNPGADKEYGTEDDYTAWFFEETNYLLYQPEIPTLYRTTDETYELYKDFVIYSTGEKITLSKEEWDSNIANKTEIKFVAYDYRLASFKLTLKDEHGEVLYSDYVMYGESLSDILGTYGEKWLDAEGNEYVPGEMPLNSMTLTAVHVHTPSESKVENNVAATHTTAGHYDSVIYCSECNEELSRETISVPATDHVPGTPVEENKIEATCTEEGHYDSVIYCKEDGTEISRTTVTLEPTGHIAEVATKENVVESTTEADGTYEEVVYCKHCYAELSRETKVIPKKEKTRTDEPSGNQDPVIPEQPSTDDEKPKQEEPTPIPQEPSKPNPSSEDVTPVVEPEDKTEDILTEEEIEELEESEDGIITVSGNGSHSSSHSADEIAGYENVEIVAMSEESNAPESDKAFEVDVKSDDDNKPSSVEKIVKAVIFTLSTTGTAGGFFFVFFWWRRHKVKGKVLSKDGMNYSNCVVTLEGRDKLRTRTNRNGQFTFRNLKKDTYILNIFNENDELLFSSEIFVDGKGKENPNVLENNSIAYQYGYAGNSHIIDIFA